MVLAKQERKINESKENNVLFNIFFGWCVSASFLLILMMSKKYRIDLVCSKSVELGNKRGQININDRNWKAPCFRRVWNLSGRRCNEDHTPLFDKFDSFALFEQPTNVSVTFSHWFHMWDRVLSWHVDFCHCFCFIEENYPKSGKDRCVSSPGTANGSTQQIFWLYLDLFECIAAFCAANESNHRKGGRETKG